MKIESYSQAKEYLDSFIRPILFQKITLVDGIETDPLDRFRTLLSLLDNPHKRFKAVHVSGTSGKGSTSYLISQILTHSGYKTGLTVSPHLERITERMQINGKEIRVKDFITLVNKVKIAAEKMKHLPVGEPSYFELLLATTFLYFAKEKVDIAVVEVGIEGKYDATLVIDPLVTILTNISLDHTHILGSTVESIAHEAVSIIRKGVPLVSGVKEKQLKEIIRTKGDQKSAPIYFLDESVDISSIHQSTNGTFFTYKSKTLELKDLSLRLLGEYQITNAACAIIACEILISRGYNITPKSIHSALSHASFPGRFEKITLSDLQQPIILDGAHNPAKIEAFLTSLERLYPSKKIFMVAFKKDKDTKKLLTKILPYAEKIIVSQFHQTTDLSMRAAASIYEIKKQITGMMESEKFLFEPSPDFALKIVKRLSQKLEAQIIVTGSLYLVGEIRALLKSKSNRVN